MTRFSFALAVATAAAVALVGATLAPLASAQDLSPGCRTANSPLLDDVYNFAVIFPAPFAPGERIRAEAEPVPHSRLPMTITLAIDNTPVATATVPGRVAYVFPASGTHEVTLFVSSGGPNARFAVGCGALDADAAQAIAHLD
jgi:hypothetical protein